MKTIFTSVTLSVFLFFTSFVYAQQPSLAWAKQLGGTLVVFAISVTTDASGNVYTTGYFSGTADFDPGPGTFSLTAKSSIDIFISKFDASGNFVWAKSMGGNGVYDSRAMSIVVDATGNVYTTGSFSGTVDFDPGPGIFNLTAPGGYFDTNVFVCKLNAAGNFIWAKNMSGSVFYTRGNSIAIDASGNLYITGYFSGTTDFDPGPGTFSLTGESYGDIFVLKLDASGNFVWARKMGGSSYDRSTSIAIDALGNVYTTGSFVGTADFDPGPGTFNLTNYDAEDIFISKLDASGNFVWAKSIEGSGSDAGNSITVDASGNVYTTGYFSGTADFNPGPGTFSLTVMGAGDIFILKLDASGNFVWVKQLGGSGSETGNSIAVDARSNIYTTGYFQGTADFDPGPSTFNLITGVPSDIFVSKLDATGNFVWAKQIGGSGADEGHSIALDATGNIYTTGYFKETADFDPGTGIFNLTAGASGDTYVLKLGQSTVILPVTWLSFEAQQKGKDAWITWATISGFNSKSFVLERSLDGRTFTDIGTVLAAGTSYQPNNYSYTDQDAMKSKTGLLYYRLRQVDMDGKFSYSIVVSLPVAQATAPDIILKAYPNPFVQNITLQTLNVIATNKTTGIELYSLTGKLLYTHQLVNSGNPTILLNDLPALSSGIYMLKISIDGKLYTIKMTRQ